jgi:hypothetical protein
VAEVRALVESARLVTLTGAGGCGKTRLGLQVAAELLDGSGDGVWLAELAAGDDEAAAVAAAHCAHFLAVAETAAPYLTGPEQGDWLARLNADQANLRRAAGYAAGRPDGTVLVLRLGVALERYWHIRVPAAGGLRAARASAPEVRCRRRPRAVRRGTDHRHGGR